MSGARLAAWGLWLVACSPAAVSDSDGRTDSGTASTDGSASADVVALAVAGAPGAYTFEVTVRSDDLGCDHYADWWDVRRATGELVYRRILNHSHVDEQPFTRAGGPVAVSADEEVWVIAHLHPLGYTGAWMRGMVETGFQTVSEPVETSLEAWDEGALPEDCWF